MCAYLGRAAAVVLVLVLLDFELSWAQGPAVAQPAAATALSGEQLKQVETWRRQYPYVSLGERLKYESAHREDPAPKLSPDSQRQMTAMDGQYPLAGSHANLRARSLELLHSAQVDRFIASPRFGVSRMIPPSPAFLPGQPSPPIDYVKLPPLSAEESDLVPTSLLHGEPDKSGKARPEVLALLPTRSEITSYHQQSLNLFAHIPNFGHIKSRDQVAGLIPHAFIDSPRMPLDSHRTSPWPAPPGTKFAPDPKRWKIARLELVSLLKQASPRVYQSEHLPRMDELKEAPTRPLTKFESESLAKLRDGEELPTASTTNRIELLGAVRASKQCLQCHDVPYGTLLGAFSYDLRRDPPLKLESPAVQ